MKKKLLNQHLFVVVLCGGGGTRVWPLSVSKKPKQFLNFYSDKTLYQETLKRAKQIVSQDHIIVITNQEYLQEIMRQSPDIPESQIIAEPVKRNTALAMGVAAAYIYTLDPDAVIINLASDHVISKEEVYFQTLLTAAAVAYEDGHLVSVGVEPTYPHPGFGYIQLGKDITERDTLTVSQVAGFREKPDIETAKAFLATGEYLWNANNYIWRADAILKAFDQLAPVIAQHIRVIQAACLTPAFKEALKKEYIAAPEEPIDTAISEKTKDLVVLRGKFGWHDIGSWEVVYQLGEKDSKRNVTIHNSEYQEKVPVMMLDTTSSLVYASQQPVAVIGVSNIIVVDTGTGLLICDSRQTNQVKKIVEALKEQKLEKYL